MSVGRLDLAVCALALLATALPGGPQASSAGISSCVESSGPLPHCRLHAAEMAAEVHRTGSVIVYGVEFDGAALQPASGAVLAEIVKVLHAHRDWRFEVQGHTDEGGGAAGSRRLSAERAKAIVAWLEQNGIDESRLVAKGYGDSDPVADIATAAAQAMNRRIELKKLNEE